MLELMGSKTICRRILEVVSRTAEHKFTVFQIQPSRFYTFSNRYLILSQNRLIISHLHYITVSQTEGPAYTGRKFVLIMADENQAGAKMGTIAVNDM
jgi:hypothetical protein